MNDGGGSRSQPIKRVHNPYAATTNRGSSNNDKNEVSNTKVNKNPSVAVNPYDASSTDIGFFGNSRVSASTFSQAFENVDIEEKSTTVSNEGVNTCAASSKEQINDTNDSLSVSHGQASLDKRRNNHASLHVHVLHVSPKQRGNVLLKFIRNVPYQYSEIVPDFIMGPNRCALFLSLQYHVLHPNYLQRRIDELKNDFSLRILLCLVDMEDNSASINALNRIAVLNNLSLVLAWSVEEAARYLETFKAYESKDASSIQKREKDNFAEQIADVLTCIRSVNKTDSSCLVSQFGSLHQLVSASIDELSLCHGIGEKKVKRMFDAINNPFRQRKRGKIDSDRAEGT